MHFRTRRSSSGRLLDLNLLPSAYRARALPVGSLVLGVAAALAILLLLGSYQSKTTADAEVAALQMQLVQARSTAPQMVGVEAQVGTAELNHLRIGWSRVLQTIMASLPDDARLLDLAFNANAEQSAQAIVKGQATEYAAVVEFADNLRSSPFFSRVSIQTMNQATPASSTATVAAMLPQLPSPTPSAPAISPGTGTPALAAQVAVASTPTATWPGFPVTPPFGPTIDATATTLPFLSPTLMTPTATLWATPLVITPTIIVPGSWSTPIATITPIGYATPNIFSYDFVVAGKEQSCNLGAPANYSGDLIKGWVRDRDGSALSGIRIRVTSIYAAAPWSAETMTDSAGYFRFYLTKGNFKLEVMNGSSEVANELWTRSAQETGVCTWQVTFTKSAAGTPVPAPSDTPTITPTPTASPTITPTPPAGTAITGTATASRNVGDARVAIDGDTTTLWSAGAGPYQYWEETFDSPWTINSVVLVVGQTPDGNTTHVVHFYDANGIEISGSSLTSSSYTIDGQTILLTPTYAIAGVKKVRVETTSGPSYVAWREVRVYATVPPTATPTPSATPTPTVTPRGQSTTAWQLAQPITFNDPQRHTIFSPGDVDWTKFYAPITQTYSVGVHAGPGTDPEIALYEGSGESSQYRAYSDNFCPAPNNLDPLISQQLTGGEVWYLRLGNRLSSTGTYTVTLRVGALACNELSSVSSEHEYASDVGMPSPATSIGITSPTSSALAANRGHGLAAPAYKVDDLMASERSMVPAPPPVTFTIVLDIKQGGSP